MSDLKAKIERGEYEIDSRAVAGEIVTKLALIRRARESLAVTRDAATAGRVRTNRFRPEPEASDRARSHC